MRIEPVQGRFGSLADIRESGRECPLYPQKRTCSSSVSMSAKCHKRRRVEPRRSIEREGDDVVATFEREVGVTTSGYCNILLTIHRIRHRRCVDAGTGKKKGPQNLASRCVVRLNQPSLSPANKSPPAVASAPPTIGNEVLTCHLILPVL
jgi:hypothetical protein